MKPYINSKNDAWAYWTEKFACPEYFTSFNELTDIDTHLEELKKEKESIDYAVNHRDLKYMNEFTIDRSIELHFLIEVGTKYLDECTQTATTVEGELVAEYEKDFSDDDLFTRDFNTGDFDER